MPTKIIFISIFIFCALPNFAQKGKDNLQKKKASLEKQIQENNKLLSTIQQKEQNTMAGLKVLSNKISLRQNLIQNINQQITEINRDIALKEQEVAVQQGEIESLKKEYAKIIVSTHKNKSKYDKLMFVLASEDINQAYKRLRFLQQYSSFRVKQATELTAVREALNTKIRSLKLSKESKVRLLNLENNETKILAQEKTEQQKTIEHLKLKSSQLKSDIAKKNKEIEQLNRAIEAEIKAEINARKKVEFSTAEITLNKAFEQNTGKLPWPVDNGVISGEFGKQKHEIEKNIEIDNPGIYFTCKAGSMAKAVFNGKVSSIIVIPGSGKTVMVRHGKYLSVYSNLDEVLVKKGDEVSTGQSIGSIVVSNDNTAKFLFSIWKEQVKVNPRGWLRK